jgi:cysteine protease avirulence protein AvrRpt2
MATPKLILDVPVVGQVKDMSCWYASACMVAYYREAGPRLGLPKVWADDSGLTDWMRLARSEGLECVKRPASHSIDKFGMYSWLSLFGPIWCAGEWYGFGHVIVLTGIDGDTIHINDPDDQQGGSKGRKGTETVKWFNDHLYWQWPASLLYKPG